MNGNYIEEVRLEGEISPDSYLSRLPAVQYMMQNRSLAFPVPVTFFVGENGTGKSTLLEAIAVSWGFNAEGGSRNFRFSTKASHSSLWDNLILSRANQARDGYFLRAESFYNVATNIDQMDAEPSFDAPVIQGYGGVSLHCQSHGESFLSLIQNRLRGNGLYILDEPEAALSPVRILTLMAEMHRLVEKNSQFIIATHSAILMTFPGARIYQFSEKGIEQVSYRETEHYILTKRFLADPESMLHTLFSDT